MNHRYLDHHRRLWPDDADIPDRTPPDVRHGLRARDLVIAPRDRELFEIFRQATLAELAPANVHEEFLAGRIVVHRWLLLNCDDAEAAALRTHFRRRMRDITAYARDDEPLPTPAEQEDDARATAASAKDTQTILRYRISHERALERWERLFYFYRTLRDISRSKRSDAPDYVDPVIPASDIQAKTPPPPQPGRPKRAGQLIPPSAFPNGGQTP